MRTVLIVDDDPSNLQVLSLLLSSKAYHVLKAETGQKAIQTCGRFHERIDFIICDLTLPDIPGTQLALELKRSHPEAAILLVSGTPQDCWSSAELDDFGKLRAGLVDFLEKPFRVAELDSKLNLLTTMVDARHDVQRRLAA
jgi:two-component system sensor histidine kinase ChiS